MAGWHAQTTMHRPGRRIAAIGACSLILAVAGCGDGKSFRLGQDAELHGDAARAYEQYCKAAANSPDSLMVADALTRVRPGASSYYESQALSAMDEGHFDEAWRLLMKSLEIQPDHATAARLIRKIESEHGQQVAMAKTQWLRQGSASLAAVVPRQPLAVANASRGRSSRVTRPQQTVEPDEPVTSDSTEAHAAPAPTAQSPNPSSSQALAVVPERPIVSPNDSASGLSRLFAERPPQAAAQGNQSASAGPSASSPQSDSMTVLTLSRKDSRYPRRAAATPGISIELRDTDSDGEIDLDIYVGKKRIKKMRGLELGRSQTFLSPSGEAMRVTNLRVIHKSHTARLGIRPA